MTAAAADRVQNDTSDAVNRSIHEEMLERLVCFALHPAKIDHRLDELDRGDLQQVARAMVRLRETMREQRV